MTPEQKAKRYAYTREWRKRNPYSEERKAELATLNKEWRKNNPRSPESHAKNARYASERRKTHPVSQEALKKFKEWRKTHPLPPDQQAQKNERAKQRHKNNPELARASAARRRARVRLTKWTDLRAIKVFYKACPPGHEVDHIIPLRGEKVSGLHVSWNLQYLPRIENRRKKNRFDIDL